MPHQEKKLFWIKDWIVKDIGLNPFLNVFNLMKNNNNRSKTTDIDELWIVEHLPAYTLGLKSDFSHLPYQNPWNIPIIQCDRGGQITYHGPGQIIIYIMTNLDKRKITARSLVQYIEKSICETLHETYGLIVTLKEGEPGVYLNQEKIASIGLRVRNNRSYHGLSLNFNMDLTPFTWIHPCGYKNLQMTNIKHHAKTSDANVIKKVLIDKLTTYIPATL